MISVYVTDDAILQSSICDEISQTETICLKFSHIKLCIRVISYISNSAVH